MIKGLLVLLASLIAASLIVTIIIVAIKSILGGNQGKKNQEAIIKARFDFKNRITKCEDRSSWEKIFNDLPENMWVKSHYDITMDTILKLSVVYGRVEELMILLCEYKFPVSTALLNVIKREKSLFLFEKIMESIEIDIDAIEYCSIYHHSVLNEITSWVGRYGNLKYYNILRSVSFKGLVSSENGLLDPLEYTIYTKNLSVLKACVKDKLHLDKNGKLISKDFFISRSNKEMREILGINEKLYDTVKAHSWFDMLEKLTEYVDESEAAKKELMELKKIKN
ncbi:hypothetical protein KAS08_00440 [Candidatus Pacearchaeota archaeon]|nr:hypothetical protein [Candidatus Pacearchaeota archaeon]